MGYGLPIPVPDYKQEDKIMGIGNPLDKLNTALGGKPSSPSQPVQQTKNAAASIVDKVKSVFGGKKPAPPPQPKPKGYKKGGVVTKGKKGC